MKARIITAIVALCLFVPICVFSGTVIFPVAFSVLALVGTYEMTKCVGAGKKYLYGVPVLLLAAAAPIFSYYYADTALHTLFLVQFLLMFYFLVAAVLRRGKDAVTDVATHYMMSFYVIVSFASVILLRASDNGKYLYLLIFIGAWVSDTGAWFFGRLLGKHKLIPEVSPKKTVEGAIGGVLSAGAAFALYGFIVGQMDGALSPNYLILVVSGFICAAVSQFGDLIASLVKRHYGIKDYGKVFPGHGGVMDRFDSVLLVSPILYLLITYIPDFVLF